MEVVIHSEDFLGEKTLLAPRFKPTTYPTEFLFAAAVPIPTGVGLLMLSPQSGHFQVAVPWGSR